MNERLIDIGVGELLDRLASSDPVPGGGSASALAGAMGAALVRMVVELSLRRASDADRPPLDEIRGAAVAAQSILLALAEQDATAYDGFIRARRQPRDTEEQRAERDARVLAATQEAISVPLATARCATDVLSLAERLAPIGSANAISDVGVAGMLATTAVRGAALNVRINRPFLPDGSPLASEAGDSLARLLDGIDERERALRDAVAERMG